MKATEKILEDSEFGTVLLRKSRRIRGVSIRVRARRTEEGAAVIVTVPFFVKYQKGIDFMETRRVWIRQALANQARKAEEAQEEGRAVPVLCDGSILRTLLSEIVFRAAGQQPAATAILDRQQPYAMKNQEQTTSGGLVETAAMKKMPDKEDSIRRRPRIRLEINTESLENIQETGRLWLSLDRPVTRKVILFPDTSAAMENPDAGTIRRHGDPISGGSLPNAAGNFRTGGLLTDALVKTLRDEARMLLPQKLGLFAERYGFRYRRIAIKHNSSNWGSCSRMGNINLNLNLVRLPEPLCDYVILHELCHLAEPNHGPRFHALIERLCTDHIGRLISLGSPDARKYAAWIPPGQDGNGSTAPSASCGQPRTTVSGPECGRSPAAGTGSLNLVLSREVSRWRMI